MPHYFFFFAYRGEYLIGFNDHFVFIPVWPSWKGNLQANHTTRLGRTSIREMKKINKGRNCHSCSWALRGGQKVMIQPLVLTLMNRKVKADKDYNLSYLIHVCLFWNSLKKLICNDKQLKILFRFLPSPIPYHLSISIKYFTFKENLSELQPCLWNWYLVSRNTGSVSGCSFLKISWGSVFPAPLAL